VQVHGGDPTLTSCTISGNYGPDAGGIATSGYSYVTVERSIIGFSLSSPGVSCATADAFTVTCADIFGNEGGDWIACIADQAGTNGNFSADPGFCDATAYDFRIPRDSPCADAPGCGLMGSQPAACGVRTFTVCPDGSADFLTIQAALNFAADGDTIELCDHVYVGPGNRDLDYLGRDVIVRSRSGNPAACVIDCQ